MVYPEKVGRKNYVCSFVEMYDFVCVGKLKMNPKPYSPIHINAVNVP